MLVYLDLFILFLRSDRTALTGKVLMDEAGCLVERPGSTASSRLRQIT